MGTGGVVDSRRLDGGSLGSKMRHVGQQRQRRPPSEAGQQRDV